MGQRVLENSSLMSLLEHYPTRVTQSGDTPGVSLHGCAEADYRGTLRTVGTVSRGYCSDKAGCEFQDYCNHLYYIDDRCDCAWTWKRTTGLVLPTST